MKTADEAWLEEFRSCASFGMEPEVCCHHADHAAFLQRRLLAGSLKGEDRRTTRHRSLSSRAKTFISMPTNAAELRQVVEHAAAQLDRRRWWFAVVALANVQGGGMPGLRRDMLGPKLATRILALECKSDWVPTTLRRTDPSAYAAAVACGQRLRAEWGDQMPQRLRRVA